MFSGKTAFAGGLGIGGDNPVRVQTMYDSQIAACDTDEVVRRLKLLKALGCDIIRFSYVSSADRGNFARICASSPMPVVADIHFDHKMALEAMAAGAHKIRINPGNIGAKWKTEEVVKAAKDAGCAIRIGLNSGSLPKNGKGLSKADLMAETALEYLGWFESWGFSNTVVSLKASDPGVTMEANRKFASQSDVPLHLGVTEAGGVVSACVRSSWALGSLLSSGIGDTIRVSVTGSIETEVQAANEILRTIGLKKGGVRIVSCPRCGRHSFDTQGFLSEVEQGLLSLEKDITVAIMGCQVNGPGEAKDADVAVTGIGRKSFLYLRGELRGEVSREDAADALFKLIGEEF